jgi:hypothetical protein
MAEKYFITSVYQDNESFDNTNQYLQRVSSYFDTDYIKFRVLLQDLDVKIISNYQKELAIYLKQKEEVKLSTTIEGLAVTISFENNQTLHAVFSFYLNNGISTSNLFQETLSNTLLTTCHDIYSAPKLMSSTYKPFHDFEEFDGFYWLNYFSPEKMQELGGKALFDLPYATKIEEMNGGILIQIGESPEEAMTPEGEERLFKATEWVHQLIQSQGN